MDTCYSGEFASNFYYRYGYRGMPYDNAWYAYNHYTLLTLCGNGSGYTGASDEWFDFFSWSKKKIEEADRNKNNKISISEFFQATAPYLYAYNEFCCTLFEDVAPSYPRLYGEKVARYNFLEY